MTPKLVLLTGPAAGEVAQVFRDECAWSVSEVGVNFWGEVRDYDESTRALIGPSDNAPASVVDRERKGLDQRIRSLPGGEAWLVGLVLHEPPDLSGPEVHGLVRGCKPMWHPRRLAILAPDPPPLLVERVNAWGGEVWDCFSPSMGPEVGWAVIRQDKPGAVPGFPTWPEAVRAALGE